MTGSYIYLFLFYVVYLKKIFLVFIVVTKAGSYPFLVMVFLGISCVFRKAVKKVGFSTLDILTVLTGYC